MKSTHIRGCFGLEHSLKRRRSQSNRERRINIHTHSSTQNSICALRRSLPAYTCLLVCLPKRVCLCLCAVIYTSSRCRCPRSHSNNLPSQEEEGPLAMGGHAAAQRTASYRHMVTHHPDGSPLVCRLTTLLFRYQTLVINYNQVGVN